jgi:hypothetical protein
VVRRLPARRLKERTVARVMHPKLGRRGPISGHQCAVNLGARARLLGADHGINYKAHPDWEREVPRLTAGRESMW